MVNAFRVRLSLSLSLSIALFLCSQYLNNDDDCSRVASCLERLKRVVLVVVVALRQFVKSMAVAQQKG